jgi:hypothetical protein
MLTEKNKTLEQLDITREAQMKEIKQDLVLALEYRASTD